MARGRLGSQLNYGVLVGKILDGQLDATGSSHYQIWVKGAGKDYRVAVNVQSVDESLVFVHYDPVYKAPATLDLAGLAGGEQGVKAIQTGQDGSGLDYVRDNLFPLDQMQQIPPDGSGVTLQNLLDGQIERAKADTTAVVVAFGDYFADGDQSTDATFGFRPEIGVHDIHFMQGSRGEFERDNRSHGDGALFIRFTGGETIALFVRFSTQSTTTDSDGNPA